MAYNEGAVKVLHAACLIGRRNVVRGVFAPGRVGAGVRTRRVLSCVRRWTCDEVSGVIVRLFLLDVKTDFIRHAANFNFNVFVVAVLPSVVPSCNRTAALSNVLTVAASLVVIVRGCGCVA